MYTCKLKNSTKETLYLTQAEENFQVISIDGLTPPKNQINTSKIAALDGAKFNSINAEMRNIVITLKLNGNVENNRIKLYKFFGLKNKLEFYYKNDSRDVYIECYLENIDGDLFSISEKIQISLLCPSPYFKALDDIIYDVSKTIATFEFPFAIDIDNPIPFSEIEFEKITNVYNNSEIEIGLIIEIDVLSKFNKIEIRNTETGESFTLNYDFVANDRIVINTNKSEKAITLIRNAKEINVFSGLKKGSIFFQLEVGDNFFSYLVDEGENDPAVSVNFKIRQLFGGV